MGLGVFLFVLGGLGLLCLTSSSNKKEQAPLRVSGDVPEGQLYRLRLRVLLSYQATVKGMFAEQTRGTPGKSSEAFLSETIEEIVRRMGFSTVLLVTHDPTDPVAWSVLARRGTSPEGAPAETPFAARLISITPVEEPPEVSRGATLGLDEGLTEGEVEAIVHALARDEDTKHLGGFASTLDPEYPIASSLLSAKAMLAALRAYQGPATPTGKTRSLSSLVSMLQRVTAAMGPEVSAAWERYRGLSVREKDQRAIEEAVKELTGALRSRRTRVLPSPPSPAALQLALATRRPKLSGVEADGRITRRLTDIASGARKGEPAAKKAQAKLEDANRAMERLQWVAWYARICRTLSPSDPEPGSITGGWSRR